jgi:hypothetical protein
MAIEHLEDQNRVNCVKEALNSDEHKKLHKGGFTQKRAHGYETSSSAEVAFDKQTEVELNSVRKVAIWCHDSVSKADKHDTTLDSPCSNKVVETNRGPAVCLKEDHQKSETNEDHSVDVYPHSVRSSDLINR